MAIFSHPIGADEAEERLIHVGLKIFPAVIAANTALEKIPPEEILKIVILYRDNKAFAEQLAETLRTVSNIKGHMLEIKTLTVSQLSLHPPPNALFLSQHMDEKLREIITYSITHNTISFSPFRGDVERGILAGIAVSDRILPYINLHTLSRQGLELKPFFMKVAETYAP